MTSTEKNSTINEVEKYGTEVTKMCQNNPPFLTVLVLVFQSYTSWS